MNHNDLKTNNLSLNKLETENFVGFKILCFHLLIIVSLLLNLAKVTWVLSFLGSFHLMSHRKSLLNVHLMIGRRLWVLGCII